MNHLVIGYGEVGKGLYKVLEAQEKSGNVMKYDKESGEGPIVFLGKHGKREEYLTVHICFPFSKTFVNDVTEYVENWNPALTVIHSTVEVGTTIQIKENLEKRNLCSNLVYSPVQGHHPDLDKGIRIYTKWFGFYDENQPIIEGLVKRAFRSLKCKMVYNYESVELAKLLCLSRYGLLISFAKEQEDICKRHGVTYSEVVTDWELDYNEGLLLEGRSQYMRPLIVPPKEKIGGHCVIPAMEKVAKESAIVRKALDISKLLLTSKSEFEESTRFFGNVNDTFSQDLGKMKIPSILDSHPCFYGNGIITGKDVEIGEGTKIWHYVNIMDGAKIGKDCIIGSYVEIGRNVKIGDGCKIEAGAFIPEGVIVGNNVFIGPNVIMTNDLYPRIGEKWKCEKTEIQSFVSIGANATILCGIIIEYGARIGAGSVVTKSIKANIRVCGCPAKEMMKKKG